MRAYLVDFETAERIKTGLAEGGSLEFTDVLGLPQTQTVQEIAAVLSPAMDTLAAEIARQVLDVNGNAPSALFLAGGGSKLPGLQERVAQALEMDPKRVAVAGNHFANTVYSDTLDLNDPAYTTPLGIAASAGLGLISDSCQVLLNGTPAKLFRSGSLTAMELLMMNGYTYSDLLGRAENRCRSRWTASPGSFTGNPPSPPGCGSTAPTPPRLRWCTPEIMWISRRLSPGPTAACAPESWHSCSTPRPLPSMAPLPIRRTPFRPGP